LSLERRAERATLVVEDRGPGISSELRQRIFDRFERAAASPKVSGLGLGLFIARKIADGHGGAIEVESELGRGTRFVVTLPLSRATEATHAD
jgi:signal transduction histidine kinase